MVKKYRYRGTVYSVRQEFPDSVMLGRCAGQLVAVKKANLKKPEFVPVK